MRQKTKLIILGFLFLFAISLSFVSALDGYNCEDIGIRFKQAAKSGRLE